MKIIYRIILVLFFLFFTSVIYFTFVGVETDKLNKSIYNKIESLDQEIKLDLKKIKLVLDPLNFQFNIKTLGPKIISRNKEIELESIKTQISIYSVFKKNVPIKKIEISTKSLEVKKVISFFRSINRSSKLLISEAIIKKGYLIADIKLEIDENGKIKDNLEVKGFVRDGKINFFNKHNFEKINFIFNLDKNKTFIEDLQFNYNELDLEIQKLIAENSDDGIFIKGEIDNKNLMVNDKILKNFIKFKNFDTKKLNFNSSNKYLPCPMY